MRRWVALAAVAAGATACLPTSAAPTQPVAVRHEVQPRPLVKLPPNVPWRITHHIGAGIEGFADRTSVAPGTPVTLYVTTTAHRFRVSVFRMGWYAGALGRLVEQTNDVDGAQQPPSVVDEPLHTVRAPWTPSDVLPTTGWQPGDYLLRLEADDGSQSFVPLTVRGPTARGTVVLVSPVTTWQAYNRWGCCNLYEGADGTFGSRSRAVSFDRPYQQESGAGEFIERTLPVLAEAERLHLHLDYLTSTDLDENLDVLDGATAVISMGHDEYWSPAMRAAVTNARDAGANVAFLGANAMFRRIRFDATDIGPDRLVVDYKVASEDPLLGSEDSAVTSDWATYPDPEPESLVTGASYSCFDPTHTPGVVAAATSPFLAGTGLVDGMQLPGLIGPETDRVVDGPDQPRPVEILLHSPFPCTPNGSSVAADTTYYTTPSGAGVFDSGTESWVCAMTTSCTDRATAAIVRHITDNLLRIFARPHAGIRVPAADNLAIVFGQ